MQTSELRRIRPIGRLLGLRVLPACALLPAPLPVCETGESADLWILLSHGL